LNVENALKQYILDKYKSIRAFTQEIEIPYSTLDTMFKRGIQGASVSNVIKICNALDIDIDKLNEGVIEPITTFFYNPYLCLVFKSVKKKQKSGGTSAPPLYLTYTPPPYHSQQTL
jgi:dolichol kinase